MQEPQKPRWMAPAIVGASTLAALYAAGMLFAILNAGRLGALARPVFCPPAQVFAAVWGALCCAAAASLALALKTHGAKGGARLWALFITNGALNAIWILTFLVLGSATGGMIALLAALVFAALLLKALFVRKLIIPACLLAPCAAWLAFCAAVNYMIVMLN